MSQPEVLTEIPLQQVQNSSTADAARPRTLINRRRVEYSVDSVEEVRVFVEKVTTKQPLQQQMEADAGLVRGQWLVVG